MAGRRSSRDEVPQSTSTSPSPMASVTPGAAADTVPSASTVVSGSGAGLGAAGSAQKSVRPSSSTVAFGSKAPGPSVSAAGPGRPQSVRRERLGEGLVAPIGPGTAAASQTHGAAPATASASSSGRRSTCLSGSASAAVLTSSRGPADGAPGTAAASGAGTRRSERASAVGSPAAASAPGPGRTPREHSSSASQVNQRSPQRASRRIAAPPGLSSGVSGATSLTSPQVSTATPVASSSSASSQLPPDLPAPPGITHPALQAQFGTQPAVDIAPPPQAYDVCEYEGIDSGQTDSFDEEVELLRCQRDLVEAAAEIGTTSADDDMLTTDADYDDEDDGVGGLGAFSTLPTVRPWQPWQRSSFPTAVIEEDEEGISSGLDDDALNFEVGSSEIRRRLWAQSLLRLKRSIDEIYSLCEFESDEALCEQVRTILSTASGDFESLMKQLNAQQEYALLGGDFPFKSGVAWTTRTPRASNSGETALEQLERERGSPSHSSISSGRRGRESMPGRSNPKADPMKRRSPSSDARSGPCDASGGGTGEAAGHVGGTGEDTGSHAGEDLGGGSQCESSVAGGGREEQLQLMVQSALQRVHNRHEASARPSPEELLKRSEDRQRRAQQLRASMDDQRMLQGRQTESRIAAAKERRREREQVKQRELLDKMTRARRQYQDQLRNICQKARRQNMKSAEVAYIAKEALKSEQEHLKQKHANAHLSRALMKEKMRKRLIASAERVARVSENRRKQLQSWQVKVQQELEEKERLASQRRREHIHSIKVKSQGYESRSEMVRGKRREMQEEDEKTSQEFQRFRSKHIGKLALNCDGLPDGVREEVAEQLHMVASASTGSGRKSGTGGPGAPQKGASTVRPCTPPPMGQTSPTTPRSSPLVARMGVYEVSEGLDPQPEEPALAPLPEFMLGAAGEAADGPTSPRNSSGPADGRRANLSVDPSSPEPEAVGAKARTVSGRRASGEDSYVVSKSPSGSDAPKRRGRSPQQVEEKAVGGTSSVLASDVSDEEAALEVELPTAIGSDRVSQPGLDHRESTAEQLEGLRARLAEVALADDEAFRIALENQSTGKAAAPNTAHRARLSKLAADLKKVLSTSGAVGNASTEDSSAQHVSGSQSINLDRADAVLADFCKVLGQSQREADFALLLKLGCNGMVVDICAKIKDSLGAFSASSERSALPAWRQTSNVMLNALKWLAVACKHDFNRVYMLLTNRVIILADVAVACLDAHLGASSSLTDAQSVSVLFLPQALHVLSLHMKQALPATADSMMQTLTLYLLLCGLPEKLRELFRQAEVRGMKLFDGASPLPLLLLRAMGFLGNLVSVYSPPKEICGSAGENLAAAPAAAVLRMCRRTELFGIVSILVSILLSEGRKDATALKLPQTVVSLAFQAVRILNHVARLDLVTLQETIGACRRQELYHLLVCLIDYCTSRIQGSKAAQDKGQEENELLHETIVLLGNYCLQREDNQSIMCYGEGQTLLAKITSLPLHYFMDEQGRGVLFPTILATCFRSEQNLELLRGEMNVSMLRKFLESNLQKETRAADAPAASGFGGRFPTALWRDALEFFTE